MRPAHLGVAVALSGLLLAGCGTAVPEEPAAQAAPLAARLSQVDESLAAHRFNQATNDLVALAAQTRSELAAGDLDAGAARRILAAIDAIRATLPAPPKPTTTPAPTPTLRPQSTPNKQAAPKQHGPTKERDKKGKGPKGPRTHG